MKLNKLSQQVNKGFEVSFVTRLSVSLIFAGGVKNRTVFAKNCRNIFRCLLEMMKKISFLKLYFMHYFNSILKSYFMHYFSN